jgi:hypothetical protein
MSQLEDIVFGTASKVKVLKGGYRSKQLADKIICADGAELSVQASKTHYCTPRNNRGPYIKLEVGFLEPAPPESWTKYADGDYPSDVYGYVPIELIRRGKEVDNG